MFNVDFFSLMVVPHVNCCFYDSSYNYTVKDKAFKMLLLVEYLNN